MKKRVFLVTGLLALIVAASCGEPYSQRPGVDERFASIPRVESNKAVAELFDLSGSYQDKMLGSSGRAYEAATFIRDGYFEENEEGRLIISQLSGAGKPALLWEGDQRSFREDFPSGSAFKSFLKGRADLIGGSRIFLGIQETLQYLNSLHDANPKLRSACIAFTDMEDTTNSPNAEAQLMAVLRDYAQRGGLFAIYWCSRSQLPRWQRNLAAAGFKPGKFIVSSEIDTKPRLIRFDE